MPKSSSPSRPIWTITTTNNGQRPLQREGFCVRLRKERPPGVNRWLAAYTIVHGVEASPVERTAAGELQRYLETITGIRLPVTNAAAPPSPCEFLIGRTGRSFRADVAGLTDDGFAVRRCGGLTAIEGTCGRSTLYGVYYFLETYGGCRFYARDCEVLPSPGAFRLPDAIDDRCSPALSFRDVDWFEAHDAAFAAKLRINSDHNRVDNAAYGKTMHYAGGSLCTYLFGASAAGTLV